MSPAGYSQHRVQISPVVVEKCSGIVHQRGYLRDAFLKHAYGVGVGHHERGHRGVEFAGKIVDVDSAVGEALHLHHLESGHGGAGRVGSVRTVGNQNAGACLIALAQEIAAYHHKPGVLTMGTGERIQ